jgi:pyruvate/2-oxoglutarate dehydrogenase complex dihydrolipoamide dehydrogenase (E3) component
LVAETVTAMTQGMTVDQVATHIVHGHPTLSEVVMAACANAI